jgi:hypothetical protein
MKFLYCLIALVASTLISSAQPTSSWKLEKQIPGNWQSVTVDNLYNLYLLSNSGQLKKLDAKGDSVAVYNEQRRYGPIGYLDVSNPLRILIYYPTYATVVWADSYLRPLHSLDLRAVGVLTAKAIANSYDNKLWVFDELEQKLKKIESTGALLQQTPDLRQVLGEEISPISIHEYQQRLFCYDSSRGVYVFDYYGNYERKIKITGWKNWDCQRGEFVGYKDKLLMRYDIKTGVIQETLAPVPAKSYHWDTLGRLYSMVPANESMPGGVLQIFRSNQK